MKTHGILHSGLAKLVARLGHGDMLAIVDRGFPIPHHQYTECIDLSIGRNLPDLVSVVRIVLEELEIEKVIVAEETKLINSSIYRKLKELISDRKNKGNDIAEENIPHAEFKHLVLNGALEGKEVKGFVRTGEFSPYANIILVSGVDF